MLGFFSSVEKRMRANATNWLELADKIYHYRRDLLNEGERTQLVQRMEALRGLLRDKADASKLKLGIEGLEGVLRKVGGQYYPKSTIQEYIEFFLVAAIVVLGVRTYFLQPFKIPTNSMYPSYYGMTPAVYPASKTPPSPVERAFRFVAFGAQYHEVKAPRSGKIALPVASEGDGRWHVIYREKPGKKWLVVPTTVREYTLYIDDEPVTFEVPGDFDFDWVIRDYFGLTAATLDAKARAATRGDFLWRLAVLDQEVQRGQPLLRFDVLTGDQLFVDRFSYHFFPPKVGEGFVFRTAHLTKLHPRMRGPKDQYYIKRLVGEPGDTLEIRDYTLYRNGKPITGSPAFEKNAKREDNYPGYQNVESLAKGRVVTVDKNHFMALGDNSASSLDSRYWGFVPEKDVVGRPLFIYFPFTRRWGPAH